MTQIQTNGGEYSIHGPQVQRTDLGLQVGVVAIGRNEGRLIDRCIRSAIGRGKIVVYVDSGSTDDSLSRAKKAGAEVIRLDLSLPFTAARARNLGYRRLRELAPELAYIQFVDGDCEIDPDWVETASAFLDDRQEIAIVCGRRRELFPARSIYNKLCDLEWDTPIGEANACGGDAMIRAAALGEIGGYREDLIAGEEPELCVRLRSAGWKIWRLDAEMTKHDAAMLFFNQWWRRHVRSGYAFAQGARLHGRTTERHWVWETTRALCWGVVIPIASVLALAFWGRWALLVLLIYPLQFLRRLAKHAGPLPLRTQLTFFELLIRFPESVGVLSFLRDFLLGRHGRLIEYR